MNRYAIYLLLFTASLSVGFGQSNLDTYLELAVQNNPGMRARYAEFDAAMQKVPQMGTLEDPNLRVSAFGQMVETRTGAQMLNLSLEQMFPWFGTLKEQRNAAALNAEVAFESYKIERNELRLKVKELYYPLYELDESIRLNEANLEILKTLKALAISKFQNGNGKLSDALRVDIMINEIHTDINILKEKRKSLVIAFNKSLNRDVLAEVLVDEPTELTTPLTHRDSLTNNPQLEALRKKVSASKAAERVAVKQGMPRLGVGVQYIVTQKRPEMTFADNGQDAYMAMFSVSLPIYRKKYKAAVKESQLMQTSFTEMQTEVQNNLIAQYEMASFELSRVKQQVDLYSRQVAQTKQIITLLTTAYGNDEADFEEILSMQQALLKYELLEITAKKEYALAIAKLEYLTAN
ncbi:MAG: TolC family protein [Cyclobacteriaceae bacterium]|nr:TolC family protein [Cyclobacteriaceae bacterium]MCB0498284.1 TolC family protein [Cyclobacteriaceae bacterium]MCB9239008.1 TolC family protein [Flammeovirgaceae bacterium]MCO5270730.1 TolC family protein [Cyclobacteriaceae bacterium]MCW5900832.1 TolC family protein [Cyclobacteriaceae bacterium]